MAASGRSRENPFALKRSSPAVKDCCHARGPGDLTPGVHRFSVWYAQHVLSSVLPSHPIALFGPQAAIEQDRWNIAKEKRVFGWNGLLATLRRAYALQSTDTSEAGKAGIFGGRCNWRDVVLFYVPGKTMGAHPRRMSILTIRAHNVRFRFAEPGKQVFDALVDVVDIESCDL